MLEREINNRSIENRICSKVEAWRVNRPLLEEIRKMLREAYDSGFNDGYYMRRTDEQLERENELIYEMEEK